MESVRNQSSFETSVVTLASFMILSSFIGEWILLWHISFTNCRQALPPCAVSRKRVLREPCEKRWCVCVCPCVEAIRRRDENDTRTHSSKHFSQAPNGQNSTRLSFNQSVRCDDDVGGGYEEDAVDQDDSDETFV